MGPGVTGIGSDEKEADEEKLGTSMEFPCRNRISQPNQKVLYSLQDTKDYRQVYQHPPKDSQYLRLTPETRHQNYALTATPLLFTLVKISGFGLWIVRRFI